MLSKAPPRSWAERLRRFLGWAPETAPPTSADRRKPSTSLLASTKPTPVVSLPVTLALHLGIDFGTQYTNVCFRDRGRDVSEIVTVGAANRVTLADALFRSHIEI